MQFTTILIELNFVAFETTVLIRYSVVCVLSARNGLLSFRALKTHTTIHSVFDGANYLFVGLPVAPNRIPNQFGGDINDD